MTRPFLMLVLLVVLAFGLGARVQPQMMRAGAAHDSDNVFKALFGEGRRMFANHFAVKADVYLHSGFYPSIFDQAAQAEEQVAQGNEPGHVHTSECDHDHEHEEHGHEGEFTNVAGHECDTSFMGPPLDWLEALGRKFMVTEHTHLEGGKERDILPWLELSADLDPQRIETYLVTAYWLARIGKVSEAEQFLRRGLSANPQSYEILFELGKVRERYYHDPLQARNIWRLALRRWDEVEAGKEEPNRVACSRILGRLAESYLETGQYLEAIKYFQAAKDYSPSPESLEQRIQEVWLKFTLPTPETGPAPH